MSTWLNAFADGRAGWMIRWYVQSHVKGCGKCRHFLQDIVDNKLMLRQAKAALDSSTLSRLAEKLHQASASIGSE